MYMQIYIAVLVTVLWIAECARILGVFYFTGSSHYLAGSTLMKILAEKGHEVTIMSPFTEQNIPRNYKEIYLDGLVQKANNVLNNFDKPKQNPFTLTKSLKNPSVQLLQNTMSHRNFQELVNSNNTFDLVIVELFASDALLYLARHFQAPLIGFSTLDASGLNNRYVGNPTFPAYIPDVFFSFQRMNFWQRTENLLYFLTKEILFQLQRLPIQTKILQANIPGAPHLTEFIYNTSLIFLNADLSVHDAVPKVPAMVDIGGYHINPLEPLPEDLEKLFNDAQYGVIYFSMGSGLKSSEMPKKQLQAILKSFSKMRETILWKWEGENLTNKPENVQTRHWFPQQDVLGHRNMKLFISHGGLFSVIESIYYGVPMLMLPISFDQHSNAARAKKFGYAMSMEFGELTEQSFTDSIREVLQNPRYRLKAIERSLIMRDKPLPPRDVIVSSVEYVLRTEGARHLRVASLDLPWYQYMFLDVFAFILVTIIILYLLIVYSTKYLLKLYVAQRRNKNL